MKRDFVLINSVKSINIKHFECLGFILIDSTQFIKTLRWCFSANGTVKTGYYTISLLYNK